MLSILVVDDSAVARRLITRILTSQPDIRVVGEACDGAEAVSLARALDPDVITMDIRMPVMDGYEATAEIMSTAPRPIVMCSADEATQIERSFRAVDAGATMVLRKPVGFGSPGADRIAGDLIDAVRSVAGLKLVTRRRAERTPPAPPAAERPGRVSSGRIDVVAIAASTGGPAAVSTVLRALPVDLPVPILLVQHIADGFDAGFATYLDSVTPLSVRLARSGDAPQPGQVLIAPNGAHMTVTAGGRIHLSVDEPIGGHRPSATPLFASVAAAHGASALGVILTGIGRDGCDGLGELRRAGGTVIAQDRETSVVWGMPRAAIESGWATAVLGIDAIAAAVVGACRRGRGPAEGTMTAAGGRGGGTSPANVKVHAKPADPHTR